MGRKRFDDMNCGIAQALEAFGDWWTLLIVRDAFFGARRFGDFETNLGIAKNILVERGSSISSSTASSSAPTSAARASASSTG